MKFCPQCQQTYSKTEQLCPNDQSVLSLQDPYHLVGSTLMEKYRIEALVGLGGMGAVYCAHHLGIDRRVAFKILQPNIAVADERLAELFEREAKVAGRLTHENIVDVKDAGRTDDGIAYIVMEWLEGRTLEEELKEKGRFSFLHTAEILRQITAALEEAHSKHVVHRDLKPANVMLVKRPEGREQVKVLDFGIGKVIGETGSSVSAVMGTPSYASPEQLQLGMQIDARTDIYSLGVILYRILSGRLPFDSPSLTDLIRQQLTAAPPLLGNMRPETPAAIQQLINRMLAKDPAERPQSASEVAMTFDQALAEAETSGLDTRLLAEGPSSGETTILKAQELIAQPTEPLYPSTPPDASAGVDGEVPATRQFTHIAAAQRASRLRARLIYASLIALAAAAAGYGLYSYAPKAYQSPGDAESLRTIESPSTLPAAPTPMRAVPEARDASLASSSRRQSAPSAPQQDRDQGPSAASRRLADQHFLKANELYHNNDYKGALIKINEALKLNPQHRRARSLRRKILEIRRTLDKP